MQECGAVFSLRNNGNSAGGPIHDMTLLVGDNRYEAERDFGGVDIFPDQAVEGTVHFRIPLGVDPTKLRIVPVGESLLDSLIPFYNEWITYDLS